MAAIAPIIATVAGQQRTVSRIIGENVTKAIIENITKMAAPTIVNNMVSNTKAADRSTMLCFLAFMQS